MKKLINEILEDLYKLDSSFKENEKEIKEIIKLFIKSKPDTDYDEDFKFELRDKIVKKIHEKNVEKFKVIEGFNVALFFRYFIGGVVTTCMVFFVGFAFIKYNQIGVKTNQSDSDQKVALDIQTQINTKSNNAFGDLSFLNDSDEDKNIKGLGGGGGLQPSLAKSIEKEAMVDEGFADEAGESVLPSFDAVPQTNAVNSLSIEEDSSIVKDEFIPTRNKYIYSGLAFEIPRDKMMVYKRMLGNSDNQEVFSLLKLIDIKGININKLKNARVGNISLVEDRDFGYRLNIDFEQNSIYLYANFAKWPQIDLSTIDDNRMKIDEYPSDEKLLEIAEDFIKEYKIDLINYGTGIVVDDWKEIYENTDNKEEFFISESVRIVYPLLFNGSIAYDMAGYPVGLSLVINVRYNKLESIGPISSNKFESSEYNIIQEPEKILKAAESGGLYGGPKFDGNFNTNVVYITNPRLEYVKMIINDKGVQDYYVPAIMFDTIDDRIDQDDKGIKTSIPNKILVPLVEDFYR